MSKADDNAVIDMNRARGNPSPSMEHSEKVSDNKGGGEPPMDKDKYVTHEELELSNEKLLHHMDNRFNEMNKQMDKRFNDLSLQINNVNNEAHSANWKANWIFGILATVVASIIVAAITKLL